MKISSGVGSMACANSVWVSSCNALWGLSMSVCGLYGVGLLLDLMGCTINVLPSWRQLACCKH
ncbi:hypothetical protein U1Q18_023437 [Sarracenia purpurea var. burkii]